jgi:hypothetical protein
MENGRTGQAEHGLARYRSEGAPRLLKTDMLLIVSIQEWSRASRTIGKTAEMETTGCRSDKRLSNYR